jgi:hypothetical protein
MLATTLPAEFAPTNVISQDVDDVGFLAEFFLESR